MKRILVMFFMFITLLNTAACVMKQPGTKIERTGMAVRVMKPMPFKDIRYVYSNALDIEYKKGTAADKYGIEEVSSCPVITGLKDKAVQTSLNKEISSTHDNLLAQLETEYLKAGKSRHIRNKIKDTEINYNYNNIIFINYYARVNAVITNDMARKPWVRNMTVGYDLNTGNRIELSDIFRQGVDYKKKINTYICRYIIENNYDDYEYEVMTKPFQGIKEDQGFTLDLDSITILLDEKNDEFRSKGNPRPVSIPLTYFADDLCIFDKYFDEGISIFERNKLTKKLFPNNIKFVASSKLFEDAENKWYTNIMQGELINIPDAAVGKKIEDILKPILDEEKFIKEAEAYTEKRKSIDLYGGFHHYIDMPMNAGGYLSIVVIDEVFRGGSCDHMAVRAYNYDFNRKREIRFLDLFTNNTDVKGIIERYIRIMGYPFNEATLKEDVEKAVSSGEFCFGEDFVRFCFLPKGKETMTEENWITMSYEQFGPENIIFR